MSSDNYRNKTEVHDLTIRSGIILRNLRNSLKELGLDKAIADVAGDIPEARERLGHVVTLTREAADSALQSVELAMPWQDQLSADAVHLMRRWNAWSEMSADEKLAHELTVDTLTLLTGVPQINRATSQQLHAIMMAQGFQDVTGQIVQRMLKVLDQVEQQLIELLRDSVPGTVSSVRSVSFSTALAAVAPASQDDVDDLLASLGL